MCGLAGFLAGMPAPEESGGDVVARMLERMRHRCPDGDGRWQECGVALGHRRLAIIDLDVRAAQPMHSIDGRYVIVYHGEIYNYRSLRRELEAAGTPFRTTSDTEVILALFADRGEAMLPRLHRHVRVRDLGPELLSILVYASYHGSHGVATTVSDHLLPQGDLA